MKGVCLFSVVAVALHSCGPPAIEGGFDSANPAAKMYAIENAVRDGDRTAIKQIIEQLDSDDPAVRALAIAALHRLTGETYGYNHFDPPDVRREAIARWKQAANSGAFTGASGSSDARPSAVPATSVESHHSGHDAEIRSTNSHG